MGKEFPGQTSTGHKHEKQGPIPRRTGPEATKGGNHQGTITGPGGGGIKRGGGPNPVVETQGSTGFEQKPAKNRKDSGGHGIERVDKVSEV